MSIQKVLITELQTLYKYATLLFVNRVKLYAFHQSNKDWMYNCQGWLIVRRDHIGPQYLTIINPTDFEPLFEMEHYSNFANYAKVVTAQLFFFFIVPSETGPIKFGLCFQDKESIEQFKRVIKDIQYKDRSKDVEGGADTDLLNKPDVIQILKKAEIDKQALQKDPLFKENVLRIFQNQLQRKANKEHELRKKCKFKTLAIGSQLKSISLQTDDDQLIRELQTQVTQNNYRKQV